MSRGPTIVCNGQRQCYPSLRITAVLSIFSWYVLVLVKKKKKDLGSLFYKYIDTFWGFRAWSLSWLISTSLKIKCEHRFAHAQSQIYMLKCFLIISTVHVKLNNVAWWHDPDA